jgi:hypothetical protein
VNDPDVLGPLTKILGTRGRFGHREHLELAWTYLGQSPVDVAGPQMAAAIGHVAEVHGTPERTHETITISWVLLVAVHRQKSSGANFDEFIAENPGLLDRRLLDGHYSPELLWSEEARRRWTSPDLRPLPRVA